MSSPINFREDASIHRVKTWIMTSPINFREYASIHSGEGYVKVHHNTAVHVIYCDDELSHEIMITPPMTNVIVGPTVPTHSTYSRSYFWQGSLGLSGIDPENGPGYLM